MEETDERAEQRMEVILSHLSGRITATQAAADLGISRKTFYEWLERGRMGMFHALKDRPTGRPPEPVDPGMEQLQEEKLRLEKEQAVLKARLLIQEVIRETLDASGPAEGKKKGMARSDGNGG